MKRLASALLAGALVFGGSTAVAAPVQAAAPAIQIVTAKTATTVVTAHPKSLTAVHGTTAKLSVSARGTSLRYQWYKKSPKSKTWSKVSRATSRTLSLPKVSTTASKTQYRVLVTGRAGKVYSKAATLTVRKAYKPTVSSLTSSESKLGASKTISIRGKSFNDVTRVYFGSKSVAFKKVGTTRIDVKTPSSFAQGKTTVSVASATGKSSKPFVFFTYLSVPDREGYFSALDRQLIKFDNGFERYIRPEVHEALVYALRYLDNDRAHAHEAENQYRIAAAALRYSYVQFDYSMAISHAEMYLQDSKDATARGDKASATRYKAEYERSTSRAAAIKKGYEADYAEIKRRGGKVK